MTATKNVLIRPLVTEKGTWLQEKHNQYGFLVHLDANKIEIKRAIEEHYPQIRVVAVNTMIRKGKPRRAFGRLHTSRAFKKALVTLREGDRIEIT